MRPLQDGSAMMRISPTTAGIVSGEIDVSEWDDEELIRGQRKNKRGTWTGRPPTVLPAALVRELTQRRFQRAHSLLAESLVDAAKMLRSIVNDTDAANGDRIKAAEIIFDRVLGKPKESVMVDVHGDVTPWQQLLVKAIVGTEEQAQDVLSGKVVEGEVLDDTAEEEEEAEWIREAEPSVDSARPD
jgi:hypothetical protein